jgi:hypothetical protein
MLRQQQVFRHAPPMVVASKAERRRVAQRVCAWAVREFPGERNRQVLEAHAMCEVLGLIPATPVAVTR